MAVLVISRKFQSQAKFWRETDETLDKSWRRVVAPRNFVTDFRWIIILHIVKSFVMSLWQLGDIYYHVKLFTLRSEWSGTRNRMFGYQKLAGKFVYGKLNKAFLHFWQIWWVFKVSRNAFSLRYFEKSSKIWQKRKKKAFFNLPSLDFWGGALTRYIQGVPLPKAGFKVPFGISILNDVVWAKKMKNFPTSAVFGFTSPCGSGNS